MPKVHRHKGKVKAAPEKSPVEKTAETFEAHANKAANAEAEAKAEVEGAEVLYANELDNTPPALDNEPAMKWELLQLAARVEFLELAMQNSLHKSQEQEGSGVSASAQT